MRGMTNSLTIGERIALFLKDSYAKAGILMTPDPADWSILMNKHVHPVVFLN